MHVRILFLSMFCSAFAHAESVNLTLANTADQSKRHNPYLAAARLAIDEARGRMLGAGRLPNPSLGLDFQNESRVSPRSIGISIDQAFPLTGRLRLEKRMSERLVRLAELEVLEAERQLVRESQTLVVKLLALNQQQSLRSKQAALARELAEFARSRAAKGELSQLDATQAQVDAQRTLLEGRRMEAERVALMGELKAKLGLAPGDSLIVSGALPALTLPSRKQPWELRPDYQTAKVREEVAATGMGLARARRWGDATAGFFAAQESMDSPTASRERTGFVGFRFSLPLPLWNRNEGEIAEKTAQAQRATLESRALAVDIVQEAETARAEMVATARLAAEMREQLLPLLSEQTENVEKAYQEGQVDTLTLLRVREQRLQTESAALDAARDFHLARVRYLAAVAVEL